MPAVVRVKRRIDEEPLGAFVLNGKKRRIDDNSSIDSIEPASLLETKDEISTILKFAGTVKSQDEKATTQITRLTKDEAKELARKHRQPVNATERSRQEMRASGHENRFKVVNCFRTIDTEAEESDPKEITIVDIEQQQPTTVDSTSATPSTSSRSSQSQATAAAAQPTTDYTPTDSDGYVYDLYLPENEQQADNVDYTDNYLRIHVFDDLVFEECYQNTDDESEDSNNEDYFANDYPDEQPLSRRQRRQRAVSSDSISERDMRQMIEGLALGSDDDADFYNDDAYSSEAYCSEASEEFVHCLDPDEEPFENDIDNPLVDSYGEAYASYRARVIREMKDEEEDEDDEE